MNMDRPDRLYFGKGVLATSSRAYVYGSLASDEEAGSEVSVVLCWDRGAWRYWFVDARVCAIAVRRVQAEDEISALAIDGRVHVTIGSREHWDHLDTGDYGPNALRHATNLVLVGDTLFSVGMGRLVYSNHGGRKWVREDEGMRVPAMSTEIAGLKHMDGASVAELFAVGFGGEIWHRGTGAWHRLDSPTNVKLEAIKAVGPNDVYVAGAAGTVYQGGTSGWKRIANDVTGDTFWSIESLRNKLYLATDTGWICTIEHDRVVPVDTGLHTGLSTRSLSAVDGYLLSVGLHDVALFDGASWARVPTPQD